jgi:chromosome partitioning related protein ParA
MMRRKKLMQVSTVCSTKGGVGKTTVTANIGGYLADQGKRVLMIDADVQPTLSTYYEIEKPAEFGLTQVIQSGSLNYAISKTNIEGLDIVYSDDPEGRLQQWIIGTADGRARLRFALQDLEPDAYDYVFIDTQGAVGGLQDAAIFAADLLISPIPPEMLSVREFCRGTLDMLDRSESLNRMAGIKRPHLFGVLNRMDRTRDSESIARNIREIVTEIDNDKITITNTMIPSTVVYRNAATQQLPVHRLEKNRRSNVTLSAYDTMQSLCNECFVTQETANGN